MSDDAIFSDKAWLAEGMRIRERLAEYQEALSDYYDSGAIGDPPKR